MAIKLRLWTVGLCGVLGAGMLGACGAAPAPSPKAEPPKELPKLLEHKAELQANWDSKSEDIRSRCELSAGDCMIQVRDQRIELLSIHSFPECDTKAADEREACEEGRAVERGMGKEIASYYQFRNRCMTEMLGCTAKLEAEALEQMKLARAETRRAQIEAMGKSESANVEALAAKQGVDYVRSTLPPAEEGPCQGLQEVSSCLASIKSKHANFSAELRKEDDEFDQEYAASLYQEARHAEAACYEPEFSCLSEVAKKWGATPDTIPSLKRNLELLKQRERLTLRVDPATANQCKTDAVNKHQKSIISAYTVYARQPVIFFRRKLHQAFSALHQDQVSCLRGQPTKAAPAAPATPAPKKPANQPAPAPTQEAEQPRLQAQR